MDDKELWELMSIICEGQDSEQRRKVEQYITDLQKEIERLNNIINEIREMLYKRDKDDYDIYTANVLCDIQSDFEEILRGEY